MRVGLPKNKNLKKSVPDFLAACGVDVAPAEDRKDYTAISGDGFDATACMLKQDTLVRWVAEGRLDAGIVGLDCAAEFNLAAREAGTPQVEIAGEMGIGACTLKIAVAEDAGVTDVRDLEGMRFATSFPKILTAWLNANGIVAREIVEMDGSVEMAVALGEADAVMDLVETGNSLRANGLKPVFDVLNVGAVVIRGTRETPQMPQVGGQVDALVAQLCDGRDAGRAASGAGLKSGAKAGAMRRVA